MARHGFIRNSLDIKLLILYLMARVAAPIDLSALTRLALCDDGVDYFAYSQALGELVESGHLTLTDGLYSITDKGRRNGAQTEGSLALPVRTRCDSGLAVLNAALRQAAQVRAEVIPDSAGGVRLRLSLDDSGGNLLTVELAAGSAEQAERMGNRFRRSPEELHRTVLALLLREEPSHVE